MHCRGIDIVAGTAAVLVAISAVSQATALEKALAVGNGPTVADQREWTGEAGIEIAGPAEPAAAIAPPRAVVAQAAYKGAKAATRVEHPVVAASRVVARLIGTDAEAGSFAAHALALRAAIVKGGGGAVLSRIPGGLSRRPPPEMWPAFFRNAMVALGRLRSPGPAALYYNPLLDVAVATNWAKEDGDWRVITAQAYPGESFGGPPRAVPPRPSWISADLGMVEALSAITASRLADFHRFHPPEAQSGARVTTSFAEDAAYARAAWPRLAWNARQHARWTSGGQAWLRPTLAKVTDTLSSGDASVIAAAAPATDAATAEAVAGLPEGLASRLTLDMILDAGGDRRLLIGSLPEDGQVYFLVMCRLEAAACSLRRIVMVSLLDDLGAAANSARQRKR